ncbi:agmatine deiminase family protein [Parendozoicomonas haliclonae]|uniref:agmatine deiminase family protein n=1 Tax=Parendozoicomonas haliclonae TaxID=1960125 RepID=UPI001F60FF15|nr:agmatine deiminase family protein [Parendozoicomonas haliclonae]
MDSDSEILRLLPEWFPQEAVLLAWPDQQTDWRDCLGEVQQVYLALIRAINTNNCAVVLLLRNQEKAAFRQLAEKAGGITSVLLVEADYNDTWVRDYGVLSLQGEQSPVAFEFAFNGWGNKFISNKDNAVNQSALSALLRSPIRSSPAVCEGGALEVDDDGHLLSTAKCLLNPERNGRLSLEGYRQLFINTLGVSSVTFLEHGYLDGDDTDGHIDTLARFTPNRGIVYQGSSNRPDDDHCYTLQTMAQELVAAFPEHTLFELPLSLLTNAEGRRVPASYANFLINNDQIMMPVYREPEDEEALSVMAQAYPGYRIVPVDCRILPMQAGSLHCITMQIPKGMLRADIIGKAGQGIIETG